MKEVIKYTVKQICEILSVELSDEYKTIENDTVSNISYTLNGLTSGGVFILSGKNKKEREETLVKALKKNPQLMISGKASSTLPLLKNVPHIIVEDPYDAMVQLSNQIRNDLKLTVIGVTGSLGKTTTKEIIHSVLSQEYVADKNYGNRNNTKGIFASLQKVHKDVQFYVQEFGVAIGKKSMESKVNSCLPNAAVITNIEEPHLDVFGSKENILKEKIKLVTEMSAGSPAFLNYDDPLLQKIRLEDHPIVSYAVENKDADYHAENIEFVEDCITFDAVHGDRRTPIVVHSREKHNIANALAAMAVGEWFKVPLEKIVQGIDSFRSEGIRQSLTNIGGYQLYVDCYNTAPASLLGAVDVLKRLPVEEGGSRIAVLGDIVRLGTEEERIHQDVGKTVGKAGLDLALCFGNKNARILADAIQSEGTRALYTDSREQLNTWMHEHITKKDVALIKGPVARLLSKSIDQVYGTSLHVRSEHLEVIESDGYQMKNIFEKEDRNKNTVALIKYYGNDQILTVPAKYNNTDIFSIYTGCFKNNKEIREIIIPNPIYNISAEAFFGCTSLTNLMLPKTLKVIGEKAFYDCRLLENVTIPQNTIDIGDKAFASCTNLKTIMIPEAVGHIGEDAFRKCNNLKIHCIENSYAQKYAECNNLPFVLVEKSDDKAEKNKISWLKKLFK